MVDDESGEMIPAQTRKDNETYPPQQSQRMPWLSYLSMLSTPTCTRTTPVATHSLVTTIAMHSFSIAAGCSAATTTHKQQRAEGRQN